MLSVSSLGNRKNVNRMGEAEQVGVRPTVTLLILHGLVREVIGTAIHIPVADSVAQTTTPAAHRVHVFREVEQVRADAADLVQVRERMSLRLCVAMRHNEREGEDRRIVLRRATGIADFDDAVHGTNAVGLDAADERVVVLLHEFAFTDVIRAAFRAEDQEAVEARPVIHLPRIAAVGVANLGRTRNRLRLRRYAAVEELCIIDSHIGFPFDVCAANSRHADLIDLRTSW
jgi:hypothetical protein